MHILNVDLDALQKDNPQVLPSYGGIAALLSAATSGLVVIY